MRRRVIAFEITEADVPEYKGALDELYITEVVALGSLTFDYIEDDTEELDEPETPVEP